MPAIKNRAGWPGFFCVELDAVTSQRGATGAEVPLVGLGPVFCNRSPGCASLQGQPIAHRTLLRKSDGETDPLPGASRMP
jgi:hypothetical protein